MSADEKIERYFCNSCGQRTRHFVRAVHEATDHGDLDGTSLTQRSLIVECCGCENLAFVKCTHFSEHMDYRDHPVTGELQMFPHWDEAIYPPATYRSPPPWLEDLPDLILREISQEIYKSLQTESLYLATFGSRTLIDRLIVLVAGETANFKEGLDSLVKKGKLSQHERNFLEPVLQAGHAAAHRGWAPTRDQFKTILDIVEGLIHRLLVLPNLAEELEEVVPNRQETKNSMAESRIDIKSKIAVAPAVVRNIFEETEKQLKSLGDDVSVRQQKHYIVYKRNRNFASVQIYNRKKQVRIYLNIDPDTVDLSRSGVRDVRQVGHYGTGDLELTIKTKKDLTTFFDLFEISYRNS